MQRFMMTGNLTADPILSEREYTNKETGEVLHTKVCNFTVAVNDNYGDRKKTQYFRVNAWRGLGENCAKYLKKGRGVTVFGKISMNNYIDKNNNIRSAIEILAEDVEFNGKKPEDQPENTDVTEEEPLY